jgi:hypothetical protein
MSLLEVQVSALVAVLVFAGLAVTLDSFTGQIGWVQSTAFYRGRMTPTGIVASEPEVIIPGQDLTGKFIVDVRGLVDDEGKYIVTVERKAATAGDCGR